MAMFLDTFLNRILVKNSDFFLQKNFKRLSDDLGVDRLKDIQDVEIECLGYGIFDKKTTLNNFYSYLSDLLNSPPKMIKTIKITLNGFNMEKDSDSKDILVDIANKIKSRRVKENLKTMYFHTSNLAGVTLRDFEELLRLSLELTDINFEDFSLQCANWKFIDGQPQYYSLEKIFTDLITECGELKPIQNKQFRLEMSGWYYSEADAKNFLNFRGAEERKREIEQVKKSKSKDKNYRKSRELHELKEEEYAKEIEKFHNSMEKMLSNLLKVMDQIQELQFDMRNCHELLKMKNLKKKLDNVTKEDRYEKSIMSKKYDVQADEAEKELKLTIVM